MSVTVEEKTSAETEEKSVHVVFKNKGIVSPFYYGVVTSSICKKGDILSLEENYQVVKVLPLDNGSQAEKICMLTPVQYYLMATFGDALDGDKFNAARFYGKLDEISFMLGFRSEKHGFNHLNYEKFDLSILPPIGAYFAGVIASHVYANSLDEGFHILFMHLKSQSFLENLEKVGFTKV